MSIIWHSISLHFEIHRFQFCLVTVTFKYPSNIFLNELVTIMHQSFESPAPPHSGLGGDFQLIYTSFWFPGRRGICLKSRSSHPLPGYLLAAQRSICLFHGCQRGFLTSVLHLAIVRCFTKGLPFVEK